MYSRAFDGRDEEQGYYPGEESTEALAPKRSGGISKLLGGIKTEDLLLIAIAVLLLLDGDPDNDILILALVFLFFF